MEPGQKWRVVSIHIILRFNTAGSIDLLAIRLQKGVAARRYNPFANAPNNLAGGV